MEAWRRSNAEGTDQIVREIETKGGCESCRAVPYTTRCLGNGEISMSIEKNVQVVKEFFAAIGSGNNQRVLALVAEDIEWIIPGEDWPLAGTHRGHAGLADVL